MAYKVLLPTTAVTASVIAVVTTPVDIGPNVQSLGLHYNFVYGSSGTNMTVYVQTSFDGGATWTDIACFQSTTASQRRLYNLISSVGVTSIATPTDGSLSANTSVNGLIGDRIRLKYTSTGTYVATTLQVTSVIKEYSRD